MGMYSQFLQIREVLEYIGWQLRDVVHAQVTVETRTRVKTQQQARMTLLHRSLGRTYFDPESLRGVADLFPVTVLYTIKLLFPQGSR